MTANQKEARNKPGGMTGFTLVWAGQLVSVLASQMSFFAITIWAYQKTGSATALGGLEAAFLVPFLLISPVAGVMVDRYNRKLMMMVSDLIAVSATVAVLILNATGGLQIWHLYVVHVFYGLGNAFQWPAYSAAITTMVPKDKYSRANGMISLVESGPAVLSPLLAGMLLPLIGLRGILLIDVITFFLAIGVLLAIHVPQPERTREGKAGEGSIWKEAAYGFRYIFQRKGLLGLLTYFLALNFTIGLAFSVLAPYILSSTGNDSAAYGSVQSAGAIGAVVGGLLVSLWGGFKRRMKTILFAEGFTGLFVLLMGLGRSLPAWIIIIGIGAISNPLSNGASQAIWQAKVAPDVQGRVFTARRMIAWLSGPITPVLAGVLADYVTEPAMRSGSWLAKLFAPVTGTAPGSGMAVQFILAGVVYVLITLFVAFFVPLVRDLEDGLPDHDQLEKAMAD